MREKRKLFFTILIFVVIFATAVAGVWEIWEFTTDSLFGLVAQNDNLHDTMWDIICGTIVGIITMFVLLGLALGILWLIAVIVNKFRI